MATPAPLKKNPHKTLYQRMRQKHLLLIHALEQFQFLRQTGSLVQMLSHFRQFRLDEIIEF